MLVNKLEIVRPGVIRAVSDELAEQLEPNQVLVKGEFSVVSAGTEGATFTGLMAQMPYRQDRNPYPIRTGYGHLGTLIATGSAVTNFKVGDRVLGFAPHASVAKVNVDRIAVKVPRDLPGEELVFARMAAVGLAAVRGLNHPLGARAVIVGLGLVGNFAAQLFQLAGMNVLGVDPSEFRSDRARACGISTCIATADIPSAVSDWSDGRGAEVVVESTGIAESIRACVDVAASGGSIAVLGTPRAPAVFDATPMLLRLQQRSLRLVGIDEWAWPLRETVGATSLEDGYAKLVRWIGNGALKVRPLLTHVSRPEQCQAVFDGLTFKKDEYLGVVFDWRKT